MNVNSISFGKTVKVFAPLHEAVRIANAANGDHTVPRKVQKQVKKIFNDTNKGHAIAFSLREESDSCYIVSGKESREYMQNLFEKAKLIKVIKMNQPLAIALPHVLKVRKDFTDKTIELIQRTQENFALKIAPEGKSIEIV